MPPSTSASNFICYLEGLQTAWETGEGKAKSDLAEAVFCPGFQKGRLPSEKGTFSAVSGPSKLYN